jgi:hypothetical protein
VSSKIFCAALCVAALTVPQLAAAQTAPEVAPPAIGPEGMAIQEWQGVSCLWGGVIAGWGVYYYSDVLTAAVSGVTNPLLLVPLIATGFVGGCSVGYNSSPGWVWLTRHL